MIGPHGEGPGHCLLFGGPTQNNIDSTPELDRMARNIDAWIEGSRFAHEIPGHVATCWR